MNLLDRVRVAASATIEEAQFTFRKMKDTDLPPFRRMVVKQRRRLTIVISETSARARPVIVEAAHEVTVVASSVYEEANAALQVLNETRIRPFREALGEEWRDFTAVAAEEKGLIADTITSVLGAAGTSGVIFPRGEDVRQRRGTGGPARRRSVSMSPRAVWRSLKQVKELVIDEKRNRQFEEMSGPEEGSARSHLVKVEQAVDRHLKIAACSVLVSTAGVAFFAPLKIVSAGMILYSAFPVFKGAWIDIVRNRRVSIKLLDSVSFIGLIAGGYFVICSVTATIFHSSMKLMLKTEDRSRRIIADMFGQQPRSVLVLAGGEEVEIPFEQLRAGDVLVVHAGQMIAVDGLVTGGTASVDQHILTGEAQPAEKAAGDRVFAATMLLAGRIEVQVEKTGAETAAAQIRDILANSTDFRSAIQARWVKVADRTVIPTLGLAGAALALLGPASALGAINSNYVAVMKVASPLAMLNFLRRASQAGILIKDGRALEAACKVDTVVFDKTGTLTEAHPHVGEIHVFGDTDPDDLLTTAAAVEANQSHPIAQAILRAAVARGLTFPALEDARYEIGFGIEARVSGRLVRVGSARYMSMQGIAVPEEFLSRAAGIHARGASIVYIAHEDRAAGAIELQPTLRPEARGLIAELRELGLAIYIISGDQTAPTEALATDLGVDHFFAEVLPQDKSRLVEKLQREGRRVCFVGDGINDAIALKNADVSVSLRGASSLATNTAQIVLMDESLRQLGQLFQVARDYDSNLRTLLATTYLPGIASLAGVFLLGTGTGTALILFNMSMVAALVNAVWPALREWDETSADRKNSKPVRLDPTVVSPGAI